MKPQEKKYQVNSFIKILKLLKEKGAKKKQRIISTHYYGQHKSNDVEKFVEYSDHFEIHILKESDGKFTMIEHKSIPDKDSGFIVKMDYEEYKYKNGKIGLYTIDDFLHSVILYYPSDKHEAMEKEFGLNNSEVISVPYNKLLKKMNCLRSLKIKF
jgi:hypothetical protein